MVRFRLFDPPYVSYRADAILVAGPLLGGVVGVLIGYARFWFIDFWLGAAILLPASLFFAVSWEKRRRPQSQMPWKRVLPAGFIAILIAAAALFIIIPMTWTAKRKAATLSDLSDGSISHISIYEPFSNKELFRFQDDAGLNAFVRAARDVRLAWHGSGGGQIVVELWFVIHLRDGRQIELAWSH